MARLIRTNPWADTNTLSDHKVPFPSDHLLAIEAIAAQAVVQMDESPPLNPTNQSENDGRDATPFASVATRRIEAEARAEERRQISRLLHDEIGQSLTALNVKLAVLGRGATPIAPAIKKELLSAQKLLEQTMEQVQRLSQTLHPSAVEDLGLLAALRAHIKNFSEKSAIPVDLKADARLQETGPELGVALFRSIQALLADLKQAAASNTRLTLAVDGDVLRVEATARMPKRADDTDTVPDVSTFHEHVLMACGSVKFRARRNQALISAQFPMTNQGKG